MSLLEDIFLEDEANEAQELERVIEGDDDDERPQYLAEAEEDENVIGEDEAEEDKRRVDPTSAKPKRVTKNPRVLLNPVRLTGPRGIHVIPDHFKDFKFKGKGHEKEDLDLVLKKLEHWAYRLYPKFQFEDCLKKIETLGKKRPVMVHLHKIRNDQYTSEETVEQKDSSDDEQTPVVQEEDEFDKLLQQQIELARATPAPGSVKKVMHTPKAEHRSPLMMPKATSSPSISDEQKERMIRNRKLAEQRRLARLKQKHNNIDNIMSANTIFEEPENIEIPDNNISKEKNNEIMETVDLSEIETSRNTDIIPKKLNRTNIIDSSDDESLPNTVTNKDIHIILDDVTVNNTNKQVIDTIDLVKQNETENITSKKHNRSNIINSDTSDDECNVTVVNESITAHIHTDTHAETTKDMEEIHVNNIEVNDLDNSNKNINEEGVEMDTNQIETITNKELNNIDTQKESNLQENDLNCNKNSVSDNVIDEHSTEITRNPNHNIESVNDVNVEISENNMNSPKKHDDKMLKDNLEDLKTNQINEHDDVHTEDIMDIDFSDDF